MKNISSVLIVFLLLVGAVADAAPTFGAEFNFSNWVIASDEHRSYVDNPMGVEARDRMVEVIKAKCRTCTFSSVTDGYGVENVKVTYPDGWYFVVATDPAVVEVQTKPSTVAEIEKHQLRIQKHIFDSAIESGLLSSTEIHGQNWAGNHIHVGLLSTVGHDEKSGIRLFRNFLVDFSNHSELAMGIFTHDNLNAPAVGQYPDRVTRRFEQLINDVDSGKVTSITQLAAELRTSVYSHHPSKSGSGTDKYQAFNVNRINNDSFPKSQKTFELRAMRAQESAEDFLLLTRLIEKRLEFLADQPNMKVNRAMFRSFLSNADKASGFYRYVTETGLDFQPYEKFLDSSQRSQLARLKNSLDREIQVTRSRGSSVQCMQIFAR